MESLSKRKNLQEKSHNQSLQENTCNSQHPLLVQLVVVGVFQYLSISELKVCRLVNNIWNQESISFLRKQCKPIQFKKHGQLSTDEGYNLANLIQFIKCTNKNPDASTKFPVSKFQVSTNLIQSTNPAEFFVLHSFIRLISSWVTELSIELTRSGALQFFQDGFPDQLWLPNLNTLTFNTMSDPDSTVFPTVNGLAQAVLKILAMSSDFQSVSSFELPKSKERPFVSTLPKNNFKLSLSCCFTNQLVDALRNAKKSLNCTQLEFLQPSQLNSQLFEQFLQSQTETLTELKICRQYDPLQTTRFQVNFPKMSTLKRLEIERNTSSQTLMTIGPISSYADTFPKLEYLSLNSRTPREDWQDIFENEQRSKCETIRELCIINDIFPTVMLAATTKFPGVIKLHITPVLDVLNVVYSNMPQLEELTLYKEKYSQWKQPPANQIITGRAHVQCKAVQISGNRVIGKMLEILDRTEPFTKSITSLKNLKTFTIKNPEFTSEMSEVACLELMKLKSLQVLDFCGVKPSSEMVSEEVLMEMKKSIVVRF